VYNTIADKTRIRLEATVYVKACEDTSSQLVLWIRIRIQSGSRRAKMAHKNRKKVKKNSFLKYWMFSFECGRLLL
jgi:hypothetical protein